MTKAVRATGIPVSRIENPVSSPVISVSRTGFPVKAPGRTEAADTAPAVRVGAPGAL